MFKPLTAVVCCYRGVVCFDFPTPKCIVCGCFRFFCRFIINHCVCRQGNRRATREEPGVDTKKTAPGKSKTPKPTWASMVVKLRSRTRSEVHLGTFVFLAVHVSSVCFLSRSISVLSGFDDSSVCRLTRSDVCRAGTTNCSTPSPSRTGTTTRRPRWQALWINGSSTTSRHHQASWTQISISDIASRKLFLLGNENSVEMRFSVEFEYASLVCAHVSTGVWDQIVLSSAETSCACREQDKHVPFPYNCVCLFWCASKCCLNLLDCVQCTSASATLTWVAERTTRSMASDRAPAI